jgi:hypothetical protein
MVLPEPPVAMLVEQVEAVPTVVARAAERVTAHSSSGLALITGTLEHRMLVATVPAWADARMVRWVRPHLSATA